MIVGLQNTLCYALDEKSKYRWWAGDHLTHCCGELMDGTE